MSLQPSFEYSNDGGDGCNNGAPGPPIANSAGIAIPRPRSYRNRRRPSRSSGMRQRDLRRDLDEDEEEDADAGPWFRGEEELDRDDDTLWQGADCVAGMRVVEHKPEADEMERLENWNARIARLFIGGGGETAPMAEDTADVVFKVQLNDGGAGEEVLFRGHRFVLSLRSPVFRAMFYGPLAETTSIISVPDVTPTAFKAMLNYVYRDAVRLQTLQGAWQLWYTARKYMIDSLEEKCRKYLKTHLSPWNVLDTYAFAEQYGEVHILYQCLRLIDKNAGYVFASPGFTSLPMRLVKALAGRTTLSAREVEVFEAVVRWCTAEIKRRLDDSDDGEVPSLGKLFSEFEPIIRFSAFSSQEFVHNVLPNGVLSLEKISAISEKIRLKEEPDPLRDLSDPSIPELERPAAAEGLRLGLNQANDLLHEPTSTAYATSMEAQSPLRYGNVHISDCGTLGCSTEGSGQDGRRCGPGYFQCSRFSPEERLLIVRKYPEEYVLRFKSDKAIYLLGACVTETDRLFYSPKVKFVLRLKDSAGKVLSEGSESFIKKTTSRVEGGLPKVLDYGPHDVSFRNVAHIAEGRWYQLTLSIVRRGNFQPGTKPDPESCAAGDSQPPILACKCKSRITAFGATIEFEPSVSLEPGEQAARGAVGSEEGDEDEEAEAEAAFDGTMPRENGFDYGLISRIYFYH